MSNIKTLEIGKTGVLAEHKHPPRTNISNIADEWNDKKKYLKIFASSDMDHYQNLIIVNISKKMSSKFIMNFASYYEKTKTKKKKQQKNNKKTH